MLNMREKLIKPDSEFISWMESTEQRNKNPLSSCIVNNMMIVFQDGSMID